MLFVRSILPSHSVRAALYCAAAAAAPKIRLHTVTPLYEAAQLVLPDKQRHYLSSVMRVKPGDTVALFNGADGEWSASVDRIDKRQGVLCVRSLLRPQPTDTTTAPVLAFALIKNARLPALIEKATELGVAELQPLITQHCASRDVKLERLQAIVASWLKSLRWPVAALARGLPSGLRAAAAPMRPQRRRRRRLKASRDRASSPHAPLNTCGLTGSVRVERQATEAAEQCGRLDVPHPGGRRSRCPPSSTRGSPPLLSLFAMSAVVPCLSAAPCRSRPLAWACSWGPRAASRRRSLSCSRRTRRSPLPPSAATSCEPRLRRWRRWP